MKRALLVLSLSVGFPLSGCLNVNTCSVDSECPTGGRCDTSVNFCVFDGDAGTGGGGGASMGGGTGGAMGGGGGDVMGGGGGATGGGGGALGGGGGSTGGGGGAMGGGGGATGGGGGATGGGGGATGGGGGATGGGGGAMGGGGGATGGGGGAMGGGGGATGGGGGATGGGGGATGGGGGSTGGGGGAMGGGGGSTGGGGGATGGGGGATPFCNLVCSDPTECQPTIDGGVCVPAYTLSFTAPTQNATFNGPSATSATFTVQMRRTDGGVPSLTSIPFAIPALTSPVPPSTLAGSAGSYTAMASLPLLTQSYQAIAGWPGVAEARLDFSVDRLPPTISLSVAPGPYLRDQMVQVVVRSNKSLSTVQLNLTGTDGVPQSQGVSLSPSQCPSFTLGSFDRCGLLNLASVRLDALSANLTVSTAVVDMGGNPGSASTTLSVSRIRWRANVGVTGTDVRAAPALDGQGNLIIGTIDGVGLSGRIVSLNPFDGGTRFSQSVGAVQSVAVSQTGLQVNGGQGELVYFNANTTISSSTLRFMNSDGGITPIASGTDCNDSTHRTSSAIALIDAGVSNGLAEVAAVAVFNSTGLASDVGAFCSYGPRSGGVSVPGDGALTATPVDSVVTSPTNIVFSGTFGFLQRADRSYAAIKLPLPMSGGAWTNQFTSQAGVRPTGLAIGNGAIVGSWTGVSGVSPVSTTDLSNPNSISSNNFSGWDTARPPAILASSVITTTLEGGASWVYSLSQSGTSLGPAVPIASPNTGADAFVSPVVGTGNLVYLVRGNGSLVTYAGSASGIGNLTASWNGDLFTGSAATVYAHPTLDCSRNGASNGTLYVVATDGRVTAVIVDSAKLETTSPWPKWQRTAGNSGNTSFPLNPGCP